MLLYEKNEECTCSSNETFKYQQVAGSMYVRRFFNPEAKKSMLEMTSYIRKVFKEDIVEGLDWMDENTKARARKKLDQVIVV